MGKKIKYFGLDTESSVSSQPYQPVPKEVEELLSTDEGQKQWLAEWEACGHGRKWWDFMSFHPEMEDLGRSFDDVITHRICIITESDWFKDLVQSEVTAYLNAKIITEREA